MNKPQETRHPSVILDAIRLNVETAQKCPGDAADFYLNRILALCDELETSVLHRELEASQALMKGKI